jgi:FHA domain
MTTRNPKSPIRPGALQEMAAPMEKAELLADFQAKVDEFAKYHGFIEKTKQQADKFAKAVIEKVIADNIKKRDGVVAELIPLTADVDAVIADLEGRRAAVLDEQKGSRLEMEEMELRKAIGEITESEFDKQTKGVQAELGRTEAQVVALDGDLDQYRAAMKTWQEIGTSAGVLSPVDEDTHQAAPQEVDDYEEEEEEDDADIPLVQVDEPLVQVDEVQEIESVDILGPEADISDDVDVSAFQEASGGNVRFEAVGTVDDVSVVFADDEEEEDDGAANLKLEVGDVDNLLDDDLEAVEEAADERPRRAVMLYQEGTAEEQIHPFTGDVLTLGRGRDNDIQVKNDSKVSRYHCKLYRKSGNFYIEDNKSANGTLVNGELITERRLFGGEEIIIGETFFRFRIMD